MPSPFAIDVTDSTFQAEVVERSADVPVVVDFWAPWCGPCRTLGPLLERLADEAGGQFLLAKVNVDENPQLAQGFRIQSIPLVLGFRDGQVVDEFTGALPEPAIREFLTRLLPTEADDLALEGRTLHAAGQLVDAETSFRAALERDPRHGGALLGLAAVHLERSEADRALELLERVDPGPYRDEADRLAAQIRLEQAAGGDETSLRAAIAANPADLEPRFQLAQLVAARRHYEEAFEHYLEIVRRDRSFRDDGARKAILDLFAVLGNDHPLTDRYRSELGKVLFR